MEWLSQNLRKAFFVASAYAWYSEGHMKGQFNAKYNIMT